MTRSDQRPGAQSGPLGILYRDFTKERGESAVIALAQKHGAKIHQNDPETLLVPSCPWVVLDQEAHPHLYYGFFPSQYSAALAYCVAHKIAPPGSKAGAAHQAFINVAGKPVHAGTD